MQTSTATMGNSVEIPSNLEIELSYDPAIPLLGIHAEETRIERDAAGNILFCQKFSFHLSFKGFVTKINHSYTQTHNTNIY